MTSLSFPDVNVWLALASPDHIHKLLALNWLDRQAGMIAMTRATQKSFLRLITTAAVMNNKPLTNEDAWLAYDRFFGDNRFSFFPEPPGVDRFFRLESSKTVPAPKLWADAWLLAFAHATGGTVITFDRALAQRGAHCLL